MSNDSKPRIYVACLAAYNRGHLHGCWIDATQGEDAVYGEIQEMLAESPMPNAEEWAIHDYENFSSLNIYEYSRIESVCQKARFIQEYGELGAVTVGYYGDLESAEDALNDYYHGEWDNELEFATELFYQLYAHNVPENIRCYIDYKKFSDDLFSDDYFSFVVNDKVHVFSHH